jgi:hypothetical protein
VPNHRHSTDRSKAPYSTRTGPPFSPHLFPFQISKTGLSRSTTADQDGIFRFPLLPLGTYRLIAEVAGFKKHHREPIALPAGQIVTIDIVLEAGDVDETVTVTSDTAMADSGKTDLGRPVTSGEANNLPLGNRQPWTFGLLSANVTGRPNRGTLLPNIHANGFTRRIKLSIGWE